MREKKNLHWNKTVSFEVRTTLLLLLLNSEVKLHNGTNKNNYSHPQHHFAFKAIISENPPISILFKTPKQKRFHFYFKKPKLSHKSYPLICLGS